MNVDTGIYSITNVLSGKQYIGSAVSFARRWARHKRHLRSGNHPNRKLQAAWAKYGEDSFIFEKIAFCPITDLLAVEQVRIDGLRPHYNLAPTAGSQIGIRYGAEHRAKLSVLHTGRYLGDKNSNWGKKATPETRAKQSAARMGRYRDASHPRARAAVCIETGRQFPSLKAAANWVAETRNPKADHGCIRLACIGKIRHAYGLTWRYADAPDKPAFIADFMSGANSPCSKVVRCLELDVAFHGCGEAARWLKANGHPKASNSAIVGACKGRQKSAYGFHWKYA